MKGNWAVPLAALSLCAATLGSDAATPARRRPRSLPTRALGDEGLYDLLLTTLREVFSGPMTGKTISLLVDAELKTLFDLDRLLATLEGPLYLLRADTPGSASDVDLGGHGGRRDFGAVDPKNGTVEEEQFDEAGDEGDQEFLETEVDLLLPGTSGRDPELAGLSPR